MDIDSVPVPPPTPRETVRAVIPGLGTIIWDKASSEFRCYCTACGHSNNCAKYRRSTESTANPVQGRPLGYLMAWLELGSGTTEAHHKDNVYPTPDQRRVARTRLQKLSERYPDIALLFRRERRCRPGEPDEPDFFF